MKQNIGIVLHVEHARTALTASIIASTSLHKTHEVVSTQVDELSAEKSIQELITEEQSYKITNSIECFEKSIGGSYKSGQELRRERRKKERKS